jgi:hypothetical protein
MTWRVLAVLFGYCAVGGTMAVAAAIGRAFGLIP